MLPALHAVVLSCLSPSVDLAKPWHGVSNALISTLQEDRFQRVPLQPRLANLKSECGKYHACTSMWRAG